MRSRRGGEDDGDDCWTPGNRVPPTNAENSAAMVANITLLETCERCGTIPCAYRCSKCWRRYCSRDCQRSDWERHAPRCIKPMKMECCHYQRRISDRTCTVGAPARDELTDDVGEPGESADRLRSRAMTLANSYFMNAFDELAARYKIRARKTIKLFEMITNALAVRPEPLDTTMRTLLVAYMEDVTDTYSRLARVPGEDPDFLVMCSELGKSAERTKRVLEQSDLPVPAV